MPEYEYETCNLCKGTGHYNGTCKACQGVGKVMVKQPPEKCPACHGTGHYCGLEAQSYCGICKHCGGSGWQQTLYPTKAAGRV